jgi:type III pantothenate kinase
MLLVVDVGNTQTVLGIFDDGELIKDWRLTSSKHRTTDEYAILLRSLFQMTDIDMTDVDGCIISSVVPPMVPIFEEMIERYFDLRPLVVGPGVKTGMPILYENPREVGADRIVNAVAAYDHFKESCIVVDFGTATTFDAISKRGEYMGGVICPGISISAEALYVRASKLPRVELRRPNQVIGRNTIASMQSGLVYGYVSLVDGMVERIREEYGEEMRVIATGGLASRLGDISETVEAVDHRLTLTGLRLLYERNQKRQNSAAT